jgi:diacylglycerol kinase (ATP)
MRRTLVIWNPASGKAKAATEVLAWLKNRPDTTIWETKAARDASQFAARGVEEGYDLIVAAGGDGTINSVANGIANTGQVANVGVLPMGTANDLAFTLALPLDLQQAAEWLYEGEPQPFDLIEVETERAKQWFANMATGGNSNRVTESLTDEIKQTWGPLAYLRGAIGVLVDLGSFEVTVRIDDQEQFTARIWNMLVANGRTNAGRLPVAPNAQPDDGLLDLILIRDGTLVDLAAIATEFAILPINYLESDQVIYRQAKEIKLTSDPPMKFSIDGEIIEDPPRAFRIKSGAINMIYGPDYLENQD